MSKKRFSVSVFLLSVFLSCLVSFSCQMCLTEAFSLPVNTPLLLACCFGVSLVCAGVFLLRRSGLISLIAVLIGALLIVYYRAPLLDGLMGTVYSVTKVYAKAFPQLQPLGYSYSDSTAIVAILGAPLAWFTARTICREGSVLLVLLGCLPVLILCLIIVNVAPVFWLILLTGGLLVLLVSQNVRDRSSAEGSYLAWWLVLPTVILIAGITVLWPPASYARADWSATLQTLAEAEFPFRQGQSTVAAVIHRWNPGLKTINLATVGPKAQTGLTALHYRSDTELSLLRGVSLGVYRNNTWTAVPDADYADLELTLNPLTMTGWAMEDPQYSVMVQTVSDHANLLTPYGMLTLPGDAPAIDDAYVQNPDRRTAYTITYRQLSDALTPAGSQQLEIYETFVHSAYTQVPEELQAPLAAIAREAGLTGLAAQELPEAVSRYVRSSGVYDLDTPRIPLGEDFVLYFLQESNRGYCVHFASSAAMLLRSLGVPARYVTGYSLSGPAETWNTVTEDDAHAWVEYYVDGVGWLPLDPTPAAADEPAPDEPDEPSEPDEPIDTPPSNNPDTEPQTPPAQEPQQPITPDAPNTQEPSADTAPAEPGLTISPAWLWLLLPVGLTALCFLRRKLVLDYRRKRFTIGHPNRQALSMWRLLLPLSRISGEEISEQLLHLAEKAKFSQHMLNKDELGIFRAALERRIAILKTHSLFKRLWYRFGPVLY